MLKRDKKLQMNLEKPIASPKISASSSRLNVSPFELRVFVTTLEIYQRHRDNTDKIKDNGDFFVAFVVFSKDSAQHIKQS